MHFSLLRPLAVTLLLLFGLPGRYCWLPSAAGQATRPVPAKTKAATPVEQLPAPPAAPKSPQERREAQTRQQALAERRPGEADTTFLRRVLPVSFAQPGQVLAATWRPSAFGKQLFLSANGTSDSNNEYGTDLFMLDPFQPNTYAVQVFAIPTQGDQTNLAAFFFADLNQDGQKELLAIGECSLREGNNGRTAHYQTVAFQYLGLTSAGRPRYQEYPGDTAYLDELATVADVRAALARHQRPPAAPRPPLGKTKK